MSRKNRAKSREKFGSEFQKVLTTEGEWRKYPFKLILDGVEMAAFSDSNLPDTQDRPNPMRVEDLHGREFELRTCLLKDNYGRLQLFNGINFLPAIVNWYRDCTYQGCLGRRKDLLLNYAPLGKTELQWKFLGTFPIECTISADRRRFRDQIFIECFTVMYGDFTQVD